MKYMALVLIDIFVLMSISRIISIALEINEAFEILNKKIGRATLGVNPPGGFLMYICVRPPAAGRKVPSGCGKQKGASPAAGKRSG